MLGRLLSRKPSRKGEGEEEAKVYKKAHLGESLGQLYYNEEFKMWVERGKEDEARAEKAKLSAPPPSVGTMSAASSSTSLNTAAADAAAAGIPPVPGGSAWTRGRSLKDRYIATPGAGPPPPSGTGSSSCPPSGKSALLPGSGPASGSGLVPGIPKVPGLPAGPSKPGSFFMPTPAASDTASEAAAAGANAGDSSSTAGGMSQSQSGMSMDAFVPGGAVSGKQPSFFMPAAPAGGSSGGAAEAGAAEGQGESAAAGAADVSMGSIAAQEPEAMDGRDSSAGGSMAELSRPGNLSFATWTPHAADDGSNAVKSPARRSIGGQQQGAAGHLSYAAAGSNGNHVGYAPYSNGGAYDNAASDSVDPEGAAAQGQHGSSEWSTQPTSSVPAAGAEEGGEAGGYGDWQQQQDPFGQPQDPFGVPVARPQDAAAAEGGWAGMDAEGGADSNAAAAAGAGYVGAHGYAYNQYSGWEQQGYGYDANAYAQGYQQVAAEGGDAAAQQQQYYGMANGYGTGIPSPGGAAGGYLSAPPVRSNSMHTPGVSAAGVNPLLPPHRPSVNGSGSPPLRAESSTLTVPAPAVAGDTSMLTMVRPSSPYARPRSVSPLAGHQGGSGSSPLARGDSGFPIPSPPTQMLGKPGVFVPAPAGRAAAATAEGLAPWQPDAAAAGGAVQQRSSVGGHGEMQGPAFGAPMVLDGYMGTTGSQPFGAGRMLGQHGAAAGSAGGAAAMHAAAANGNGLLPGAGHRQLDADAAASKGADRLFGPGSMAGGAGSPPWQQQQQQQHGHEQRTHPYDAFLNTQLVNTNWRALHFKQPGKLNRQTPYEEFEMQRAREQEAQEALTPTKKREAFWYRQMEHRRKLPAGSMKPSASEPAHMPSHAAAGRAAAAAAAPPSPGNSSLSQASNYTDWQQHHNQQQQQQAAAAPPCTPAPDPAAAAAAAAAAAGIGGAADGWDGDGWEVDEQVAAAADNEQLEPGNDLYPELALAAAAADAADGQQQYQAGDVAADAAAAGEGDAAAAAVAPEYPKCWQRMRQRVASAALEDDSVVANRDTFIGYGDWLFWQLPELAADDDDAAAGGGAQQQQQQQQQQAEHVELLEMFGEAQFKAETMADTFRAGGMNLDAVFEQLALSDDGVAELSLL
ncbi:hypothetical protein OEZ85_006915 [Tetradesmus obliquus]|uniref:Uncharacterized protein n=1 Tax=Tetradesmus obliquus TaxID=3088 RepID=A0ABY8TWG2_TETOB|nr:hypothetical protein OEZ85_006915 [Tetradesmus obliquus]